MFSQFLDRNAKTIPNCEKRKFFDAEEEVFFKRLQMALPNCCVFPNVQLNSLLAPDATNEKQRLASLQKLRECQVDFGVFDKNLEILCVVELDKGAEANGELEEETRQILKDAGIKSVRWSRARLPSYEQILRTMAPFSNLDAPKAETSMQTIGKMFLNADSQSAGKLNDQVFTYVEHGNPNALSLAAISRITPKCFIKTEYPHIWQKICLFAGDPNYLKNYLESLFIQNRPLRRIGLPKHVANEVMTIQSENSRFITPEENQPIWDPHFLHR